VIRLSHLVRALFLGAGASFDAGMPLVTELTAELRRWLTRDKLLSFNSGWRARGGGWSDKPMSTLVGLLQSADMHYEQIIGAIEVEFARELDTRLRQELHGVQGYLLQAVRGFLVERQIRYFKFALTVLDDFAAIKKLTEDNKPLWIFSTNHDMIVEILAAKFSIPIKSGFKEKVTIGMDAGQGKAIEVAFERLPRPAMTAHDYDFFRPGETGINLLKLHGSMDIFGQGDELSYIKVACRDGRAESYVEQLQSIRNIDLALGMRDDIRANNEHCYLDSHGAVQYLRNSLLSGTHKFSPRMSQVAPPEFLSLFGGLLNYASELVCIGYGFGDQHINDPMAEWLSRAAQRRLTIVNPGIRRCPERFGHLCHQVSLVPQGARQYFIDMDGGEFDAARDAVRQLQTANRKRRMDELLAGPDVYAK
jgi:hypothetical protein